MIATDTKHGGRLADMLTSGIAPGVCFRGQPSQREEVLQGFRRLEEKLGTSTLERGIGMKSAKIKRIWERD